MKPNKHRSFEQNQHLPGPASAGGLDQNEMNFTPSPDEVARRAYFAYENQGSADGRAVQHWLTAEAELIAGRNLTRTHRFHNPT